MRKRRPATYARIPCEDERFVLAKYKLMIRHDTETGHYLFLPDVRENYPGEFAVGAFDKHLENLVKTDVDAEYFRSLCRHGCSDKRLYAVSRTIEKQVYEAFETFCFDEPINQYQSDVRNHGEILNEFLEFCCDCQRCREERIGIDETDYGFVPLTTESGRDYCDARQQQLCAVIYSLRQLNKH